MEKIIYKDLKAYLNSGFSEIQTHIGLEINQYRV